jgi:hypothetical protein
VQVNDDFVFLLILQTPSGQPVRKELSGTLTVTLVPSPLSTLPEIFSERPSRAVWASKMPDCQLVAQHQDGQIDALGLWLSFVL